MSGPAFRGIIPPLVTPLDEAGEVDVAAIARLVDRTIAGGVHGLFAVGTTGEGPSLTQRMRQEVVAAVGEQAAGRVPVLVGITDTVVSASIELAEAACAAGASAAVVAPPYYLAMTQAELIRYTERLVERIPLPLMLYNMPSCCKTWYEVESVKELAANPRIRGLKDSSGDLDYLQRVMKAVGDRTDFAWFVGPEEMLVQAMRHGAHGGVNGGANMFPSLYVQMYAAAADGNWTRAEALQQIVQGVSDGIYQASDGASRVVKGTKTALKLMGVCGDQMAEPFEKHSETAVAQIQAFLNERMALVMEHVS
jgi:4-hydroxy-tetrahydrodipicolinate synthase